MKQKPLFDVFIMRISFIISEFSIIENYQNHWNFIFDDMGRLPIFLNRKRWMLKIENNWINFKLSIMEEKIMVRFTIQAKNSE